jgi:hypothetical protein
MQDPGLCRHDNDTTNYPARLGLLGQTRIPKKSETYDQRDPTNDSHHAESPRLTETYHPNYHFPQAPVPAFASAVEDEVRGYRVV